MNDRLRNELVKVLKTEKAPYPTFVGQELLRFCYFMAGGLLLVFLGFYQNFTLVAHVALTVRIGVVENMRLASGLALGNRRHSSPVVCPTGAGTLL